MAENTFWGIVGAIAGGAVSGIVGGPVYAAAKAVDMVADTDYGAQVEAAMTTVVVGAADFMSSNGDGITDFVLGTGSRVAAKVIEVVILGGDGYNDNS